ncbi:FAD-binding domain-containing protein [[Phormidium] sp. ETS-05]|uniref:FAD-binding domain-containing protein n=1 Tax=[Phormidium] sp. ETS-05 TaxID=222819 RepID=UPI0018EEF854|nr:FAD-binding domain-containing protein [[Phormidium] sp. ETS-05]
MAESLILFWHRRDLRVSDNLGLTAARKVTPKVVGLFCLDPQILQRDDIAPARMAYMLATLQELQQHYARLGSQLLILHQEPSQGIPALAKALGALAVYWNLDVEPYSQQRDAAVKTALKTLGVEVKTFWDQLLHPPGQVVTGGGKPYTVYTPFWKNWSRKPKAAPLPEIEPTISLTWPETETAKEVGVIPPPTAKDLGYIWDRPLAMPPGQKAAQAMLDEFCRLGIFEYEVRRNFPADTGGTSMLSAALKFGAVGIRSCWEAAERAWEQCRSDEERLGVRTWQQELAWREFYQNVMYHFPELADGPYRAQWKDFPWENNQIHFQAWCEGRTGYPMVDAAMRQLNDTGWMHNRCRMIVASFLTKDLMIDWRWGEKYFMQNLIDGDLSANNGGWQWSASSGMDPKPIRMFNPAAQAKKFDPEAEYIRRWLPELEGVDEEYLVTGKIPEAICAECGYPMPIVDHNKQQRRFKELYQRQKAKGLADSEFTLTDDE